MVYDANMKCAVKLTDGINNGSKISILGSIPSNAHRFCIDFVCGPSLCCQDDIAFHLNPRFDQMVVVRNALIDEKWGSEVSNGGMPLSRGEVFDVVITCDEQSWKVAFNGQHFCEFPHRVQYHRITHMGVYGDVNIKQISF